MPTTHQQSSRRATSPFGAALKDWRALRRMSQLDLALAAEVSARHVAFLETGRAEPSRDMVVALSVALEVPLRSRNTLLAAAGFASLYPERSLDDKALAPIRAALELMLARHDPYPGILLDRHWNLIDANVTAKRLFAPLLQDAATTNIVELLVSNPLTETLVADWPVVATEFTARLKLEAAHGGHDPKIEKLIALLAPIAGRAGTARHVPPHRPFLATAFNTPGGRLEVFSTIAEFGTVEDITVRDLRLELFFPADEASAKILRTLAG